MYTNPRRRKRRVAYSILRWNALLPTVTCGAYRYRSSVDPACNIPRTNGRQVCNVGRVFSTFQTLCCNFRISFQDGILCSIHREAIVFGQAGAWMTQRKDCIPPKIHLQRYGVAPVIEVRDHGTEDCLATFACKLRCVVWSGSCSLQAIPFIPKYFLYIASELLKNAVGSACLIRSKSRKSFTSRAKLHRIYEYTVFTQIYQSRHLTDINLPGARNSGISHAWYRRPVLSKIVAARFHFRI